MTDLINKNADEVNVLIKKFSPLFPDLNNNTDIPILCVMFEVAITHISEKYSSFDASTKTWGVMLIKTLYDVSENLDLSKLSNEQDIRDMIDDFMTYRETEYNNYIDSLAFWSDEFSRDHAFLMAYIQQKSSD